MKHLHLTLGYLKEQRAKLDTSIALLEAFIGGNGHRSTLKTAADALAMHEFATLPTTPRRRPGPPRSAPSTYAQTKARRAAKQQAIIEILREAGPNGLLIRDLAAAARERGIGGLTGIQGMVGSLLKKTGKVRGQFRYSVIDR